MYDIASFIDRHFQGDYQEYGSPISDLRVNCPFCETNYGSPDDQYKLHISLHLEVCHCFRCDYKASWVKLVMDLCQVTYPKAVGLLYVKPKPVDIDKAVADVYGDKAYTQKVRQPRTSLIFPKDYVPILEFGDPNPYKAYLRKRGFTKAHMTYYRLGVAPSTAPHRVYIPVEGTYYQARAIYPFVEPKYMTPVEDSIDLLFNPVALQIYDEVVITEGCLSAMAVGKNAIALLGANPTQAKIDRLIASRVRHFIITVEEGKEKQMVMLARKLQLYNKRVTMWYYPPEKDPADSQPARVSDYDLREHVAILLAKP